MLLKIFVIKYLGGSSLLPLVFPLEAGSPAAQLGGRASILSYLSQPQSLEEALLEESADLDLASPSVAQPPSAATSFPNSGLRSGARYHQPVVPFSLAFSPCHPVPPSPFVPPASPLAMMPFPVAVAGQEGGTRIQLPAWHGQSHIVDYKERLLDFAWGLPEGWGGVDDTGPNMLKRNFLSIMPGRADTDKWRRWIAAGVPGEVGGKVVANFLEGVDLVAGETLPWNDAGEGDELRRGISFRQAVELFAMLHAEDSAVLNTQMLAQARSQAGRLDGYEGWGGIEAALTEWGVSAARDGQDLDTPHFIKNTMQTLSTQGVPEGFYQQGGWAPSHFGRVKARRDERVRAGGQAADTWAAFVADAVAAAAEIGGELVEMEGTPWAADYQREEARRFQKMQQRPRHEQQPAGGAKAPARRGGKQQVQGAPAMPAGAASFSPFTPPEERQVQTSPMGHLTWVAAPGYQMAPVVGDHMGDYMQMSPVSAEWQGEQSMAPAALHPTAAQLQAEIVEALKPAQAQLQSQIAELRTSDRKRAGDL